MITVDDVIAIILRCKYIAAQNMYAELCNSDNPDYDNHHKMISAWLTCGEVWYATDVYNKIPCCFSLPKDVDHELHDFQEADDLQESVYPASQPISERWVFPNELSSLDVDENNWWAGRVSEITEEGMVYIVVARNYTGYRKNTETVISIPLSILEFISFSGESPTLDMFLYLSRNKSGQSVIVKNKRN